MFYGVIFRDHCYLIVLLSLIAVAGDFIVQHSNLIIYRAFFDNITHAVIGGISWLIVCMTFKNRYSSQTLVEIALSTAIASCIDIDHFIAARSLHLKDATNLTHRPVLHCSTFPFLLSLLLLFVSYVCNQKWLFRLSLIILTAFASHHTRDAARRGFWFYPFGSTPPISYLSYILLTIAIPYCISAIMFFVNIEERVANALEV